MHVVETCGRFGGHMWEHGKASFHETFGKHRFLVFVCNGTREEIVVQDHNLAFGSTFEASFGKLPPGQAGIVRFVGKPSVGGAVSLNVGKETVRIGAYRFAAKLSLCVDVPASAKSLRDFYKNLPDELMGAQGARPGAAGESCAVFVGDVTTEGANVVAHVTISPRSELEHCVVGTGTADTRPVTPGSCIASGAHGSEQVLRLAEWCTRDSKCLGSDAARALFLMDVSDVGSAKVDRIRLQDKVFALNILIYGFLLGDVLMLDEGCLSEPLLAWQKTRPSMLVDDEQLGVYAACDAGVASGDDEDDTQLKLYAEASLVLLKSAALQCSRKLEDVIARFTDAGDDPEISDTDGVRKWRSCLDAAGPDANMVALAENLEGKAGEPPSSSSVDHRDAGDAAVADEAAKLVQLRMSQVQECVHASADFLRRAQTVHEFVSASLDEGNADGATHKRFVKYTQWMVCARRRFVSSGSFGKLQHESWSPEIFAGLDGGRHTGPDAVLSSLGRGATRYKEMTTNSKSGEFFFFSGDGRFLIKTITQDEAYVLNGMLAAYQAHLKDQTAKSLIVRFAGLHRFKTSAGPGAWQYFIVMCSVFDPERKIDVHYDVKGSLHNRKKKEKESTGKDEDWISANMCLKLPSAARRELREAHERDCRLMERFSVMDYSLLIGVVHGDETAEGSPLVAGWYGERPCTLKAAGSGDVYYIGLIDFLIGFGLKKKAEHVMRAAGGHEADASCVDPLSYATRQVQFVRDSVLAKCSSSEGVSGSVAMSSAKTSSGYPDGTAAVAGTSAGGVPSPPIAPVVSRVRPCCEYGVWCYQEDPDHRREFSHPGDRDLPFDENVVGTRGTLWIMLKKGNHLNAADWNGKSDPYVEVRLGLLRVRSCAKPATLSPVWDETLALPVDTIHWEQDVELWVWDEDQVRALRGHDDFLGKMCVPLRQVVQDDGVKIEKSPLQGVKGKGVITASLKFVAARESP